MWRWGLRRKKIRGSSGDDEWEERRSKRKCRGRRMRRRIRIRGKRRRRRWKRSANIT